MASAAEDETRMRWRALPCVAALALCACAAPGVTADTPRTVRAHPLPSYQVHEECVALAPGDRIEYAFESNQPVAFNLHYREGSAVVMPVVRDGSLADAGIYVARIAHDYCLTWEAGPSGAMIDYRIWVKPGTS
jgi:hypothetical protein